MARLVVLSEGFTGLAHELQTDKITIGRVEDNTWPIAEASVSSHHCEILKKGDEVVVRDLNSTNGTFVNGEPVTEGVIKPGQILRLGQLEIRLESGAPVAKGKPLDRTMVLPQGGVRVQEFEQGRGTAVDGTAGFSKKTDKTNRLFIAGGIVLGLVIVVLLVLAFLKMMG